MPQPLVQWTKAWVGLRTAIQAIPKHHQASMGQMKTPDLKTTTATFTCKNSVRTLNPLFILRNQKALPPSSAEVIHDIQPAYIVD